MSNRIIRADSLRGIAIALQRHAPHLLPSIHDLIQHGLADGPEGLRGTSIHGRLTANISWEVGEPILQALESIEREYGFQVLFGERQINSLVDAWRNFAEPRQLSP